MQVSSLLVLSSTDCIDSARMEAAIEIVAHCCCTAIAPGYQDANEFKEACKISGYLLYYPHRLEHTSTEQET